MSEAQAPGPHSPAEYALLGLLTEGPRHGYDLLRHFERDAPLGRVCWLRMSNAYALLRKLERLGLVVSHTQPQENRPPRVIYDLTPAGRRAFEAWVAAPVRRTREIRLDFLVKLYFAQRHDGAATRDLIEQQLEHLRVEVARLLAEAERDGDDPYLRLVGNLRLAQATAVRDTLARQLSYLT